MKWAKRSCANIAAARPLLLPRIMYGIEQERPRTQSRGHPRHSQHGTLTSAQLTTGMEALNLDRAMTDFPNRIIHILRSCPNGLTSKDIAERLGTTRRDVSSRLSKLAAYGIIGPGSRHIGRARHKGSNLQSTFQC